MNRKEEICRCISVNKTNTGLEIGPLCNPVFSKKEADIYYLDHMSQTDLKKKYAKEPVNLDKIVPIDYIVGQGGLKETLNGKKFDYIIASHVIEHVVDVIGWLKDISIALKEEGVLFLIIPDKRYTFDITREVSKPGDLLGAYLEKKIIPYTATLYDNMTECRKEIKAEEIWKNSANDYSKKPRAHSDKKSLSMCKDNLSGKYVDSHCYVFTPYSFIMIIRSLINHNLFCFEVAYFSDTKTNDFDFFIGLRKSIKSSQKSKLDSLPIIPRPKERWQLEKEIQELKAEQKKITNSKSWKITKPLRSIREKIN
jgi:2-polyprenyl-3-methyl-5-hydroxy-6-metoxy-1,4-benzoquinol methylase